MTKNNRYALLTVDTEALPRRAFEDHVQRLIWGKHPKGTAGIGELCSIGKEFNIKHVFFVDMCGAYPYLEEMREVVYWLDQNEQDVQLHAHSEVLSTSFWIDHGFDPRPSLMNEYTDNGRAEFVIKHFGKLITDVTEKPILAYRAGSFRWNTCSIRALEAANIPLSFNNSMRACRARKCVFSEPTTLPYTWSNGIIEVPVTEKSIPSKPGKDEQWVSLTYPESSYFRFQERQLSFWSRFFGSGPKLSVILLHSWSLLYWDETGHATYRNDQRLEEYRNLLARLTKDYDVITTRDFLDLCARGRIVPTHTVDIEKAEFRPVVRRRVTALPEPKG